MRCEECAKTLSRFSRGEGDGETESGDGSDKEALRSHLKFACHLCNDHIDGNHEQHEDQPRQHGRAELLPEEVQTQGNGERRRPDQMQEQRGTLQLLRVDRHQVDDFTNAGFSAGGSAQSQGLSGNKRKFQSEFERQNTLQA